MVYLSQKFEASHRRRTFGKFVNKQIAIIGFGTKCSDRLKSFLFVQSLLA